MRKTSASFQTQGPRRPPMHRESSSAAGRSQRQVSGAEDPPADETGNLIKRSAKIKRHSDLLDSSGTRDSFGPFCLASMFARILRDTHL